MSFARQTSRIYELRWTTACLKARCVKKPSPLKLVILAASISVFVLPWISFTAETPPRIVGDCLDCHENYDQSLAGTVHQVSESEHGRSPACSDCHAGGAVHMEDPQIENITNPSKAGVDGEAVICRQCHFTDHQQQMGERNVHAENDVNCSGCHKIHDNAHPVLLRDREPELCYGCHTQVRGEFFLPYRHPVADGVVRCSECHRQLDRLEQAFSARGFNAPCLDCHNEFQGPFPFEHQATVDYSTEEGGCLNCHAAHGSDLPRLLVQPLDPPNFALCAQCHVVPAHPLDSYHGNEWADRPCGTCHVDVHGSYVSRYLLSPGLPDEEGVDCFGAGCHEP